MFKVACLKKCLFRTGKFEKENRLKVVKVGSQDKIISFFSYSGLKGRFDCNDHKHIICLFLFDMILYVHSTIFQLCGTGLPGLNQY